MNLPYQLTEDSLYPISPHRVAESLADNDSDTAGSVVYLARKKIE